MHRAISLFATCSLIAGFGVAGTLPASAACTKLGFSVNDYGKDGPTKDAKELLDKYIAQWTAERGIKNYRTGAKSVNCELFLDFVVFDEHTCRAEATVCWNEPTKPGSATVPKAAPKATTTPASPPAPKPPKAKAAAAH